MILEKSEDYKLDLNALPEHLRPLAQETQQFLETRNIYRAAITIYSMPIAVPNGIMVSSIFEATAPKNIMQSATISIIPMPMHPTIHKNLAHLAALSRSTFIVSVTFSVDSY